ncbi:uncharacterized protein LOC129581688 [Paramacrobiotus metropolitanus]|uniref:uncharacterized protein LOC129581688 n=1 Tax=Paramacrobiotus metropolitanus TaxID=2943436 RepID=UPI002445C6E5|nr:uncharacterized protein LOC129581688 [Paramacrobiotus metropolitanus]
MVSAQYFVSICPASNPKVDKMRQAGISLTMRQPKMHDSMLLRHPTGAVPTLRPSRTSQKTDSIYRVFGYRDVRRGEPYVRTPYVWRREPVQNRHCRNKQDHIDTNYPLKMRYWHTRQRQPLSVEWCCTDDSSIADNNLSQYDNTNIFVVRKQSKPIKVLQSQTPSHSLYPLRPTNNSTPIDKFWRSQSLLVQILLMAQMFIHISIDIPIYMALLIP